MKPAEYSELSDDEIVEKYLRFLKDPSTLVDRSRVETAEKAVAAAKTETARMLAIRDLREATSPDSSALAQEFRRVFPKWASANRVRAADMKSFGLRPDDVSILGDHQKRSRKRPRAASKQRTSIPAERVVAMLQESGPQSSNELAAALGVSASAASKLAKQLVADGRATSEKVAGNVGRPTTRFSVR